MSSNRATQIDRPERDFVEILIRYCQGIRKMTKLPAVAEQAAIYEAYFQECLNAGVSPRAEVPNAK